MGVGVLLALLGAWTFSGKKAHPASEEVTRIFFTLCAGSSATYFLVLFIFNQMPSDMPLKIGVHLRFLPLLLIPIYILVGVGVSKLLALLPRGRLPILLSLFLVILQVGLHYQTENQAGNYASYRYAKAHLETLPKKAILLLSGEHYRPDISVIGRGLMKGPWMVRHIREQFSDVVVPDEARYNNDDRSPALGGFSLKDFLDANYGRVPIYISNYDKLESTEWEKFYTTWPTGLSSIILRREDRKLNQDRLLKESSEILESLNFSDLSSFPRESWENIYFRSYKETYSRLAMNLAVTSGEASDSGRFYLDLADHYFGEYFKDNPFPAPQAIKQRAIIKKMRSELH
jgi:hypothetical protein